MKKNNFFFYPFVEDSFKSHTNIRFPFLIGFQTEKKKDLILCDGFFHNSQRFFPIESM